MGLRIDELGGADSISPLDMMEIEKNDDKESYAITIKQLVDYVKNTSNGAFRGATTKSLEEFDVGDAGVWFWNGGSGAPENIPFGMLEVLSIYSVDDFSNSPVDPSMNLIIQRLTYGKWSYQRMKGVGSANWSSWAGMTNANGCIIKYGCTTESEIWFADEVNGQHPSVFVDVPSVTATPDTDDTSNAYFVQVYGVTTAGFRVRKFQIPLIAREVVTTIEQTKDSSGTVTSEKETVRKVAGQVVAADELAIRWIAVHDLPNEPWRAT